MKVFNEESSKSKSLEVILLLQLKEAKTIIEALEYACEARPRKITWKKILNDLREKAGVY